MNEIIILLIIIFTAYCINCTPLYLDSSYPEEYLNEDTIEKYDNEDFTELELQVEKIDYNYLCKLNVVQCGCPCKYGRLNGLANTSFYKNECFDQWKEFKEWKYFKCFFEKSCSTGNIYRGKLSSNSTSSTTTTITSPTANKDFTTKQPEISVGKNETELESSQINDDKELEFEKIDYNHLERINVVQCGCPCKYGKINGLDTTSFYKNECFDQWIGFIKGKYFKCFIENSCSTGIVYKGELRSNAFTSTATPATPAPDFTSTSYLTTTTNNIEIEKIDFKYLKSINVKKCECFCYLGEIYGLANTPFYKNECRWKEFIQWKTFTCFIEKSCRTRIIYRGKLSSNTTTTTVSSTTAATDFTSSSNTTSTITKIEIEKIDFRYLKSINVKLCGCMCYMGKAFDLSSTSFYKNQCFKGSKFLSWEYFFCFIKKSCQTENFIFYRGKLSSNSTSSASNTTSSNVVATSKPKIEKIDHNYLDSINVVQCGCSCKYGEFHRLANTSFYKNQCFDQWNGFIEWNSFSCFIEKTCSTGIIYRAKLSSNTNEVT